MTDTDRIIEAARLDWSRREQIHVHVCRDCKTSWSHSRASVIDRDSAHSCPKCGTNQFLGNYLDAMPENFVADFADYNGKKE